jgi:hypothetical protein
MQLNQAIAEVTAIIRETFTDLPANADVQLIQWESKRAAVGFRVAEIGVSWIKPDGLPAGFSYMSIDEAAAPALFAAERAVLERVIDGEDIAIMDEYLRDALRR